MPLHRRHGVVLLSCVTISRAQDVYTCDYATAGAGGIGDFGPLTAANRGAKCIFPFRAPSTAAVTDRVYNACTTAVVLTGGDVGTGQMTGDGSTPAKSRIAWCATAVQAVTTAVTAGSWGYCSCPSPVAQPGDSAAAAVVSATAGNPTLEVEYNTCNIAASAPCTGKRAPDVSWKFGQNGYTIFTLDYAGVPYDIGTMPTAGSKSVNVDFDVTKLNTLLGLVRAAFLTATNLNEVRAGCDVAVTAANCDSLTSVHTPPQCDPFIDNSCLLDAWRVKVFAPYSSTTLKVTVHVAPPAAILDRPATVVARLDPARENNGPRNSKSGPLQVSIAGGDWGYVCDETGSLGGDVESAQNAANIVCKQMYGLTTEGIRLHPARVPGAGEDIALHGHLCSPGLISTKGKGMGAPGIAASELATAGAGPGAGSIPFGLDQCLNVLPKDSDAVWGIPDAAYAGYVAATVPAYAFVTPRGAATSVTGRRYPLRAETCSDNEIAHVKCSFGNACNGHDLRTSAAELRQPTGFCQPPAGRCGPGEWEMPANFRALPSDHHTYHMGCCTGCPGGARLCYHDCTCMCQTGKSCAEVQPMQKNCQTTRIQTVPAVVALADAEYKIGCRWDAAARGCVDFSASPTAAPTPRPTAWPTASPTRTQPPTAYPTVADCYAGGQAICVLGYYPLWCTDSAASKSSRDYQSRPITLGGVTYHMANIPPGGAWFGDYKGTLHGDRTSLGGVPEMGTTYGTPRAVVCITPGAAAAEPSGCSDVKVGDAPWRDALGGTCAKYEEHKHWCEHFGGSRDHAYAGITANKACCACGGGATMSPTADPTADPTPPPPAPPAPPGPCKWKSRDGVKKGKLGRDCTRKCPAGGRCRWCGSNGLCANSVCTCPGELFEPIPPKACLTKRASRKQGVPCLDACMKTRYWGELPAAARRGTCDWCGKGELCLREGAIHKCVCSPVTTERRAAVAQLADEELEEDDEE